MIRQTALILSLVLICILVSGCSLLGKRVNAFERGNLAQRGMLLVEDPKEMKSMNHMFNAREGSAGGLGGAGGGCGCN